MKAFMKRKITSFAALVIFLLTATTMMAEQSLTQVGEVVTAPQAGQYYVIQGNGQANQITWLYDNGGTTLAAIESSEAPTGTDAVKYVWVFEVTDDGYAAQNLITGRYIFIAGTSNGGAVNMQSTPAYFTIEVNGDYVGFKNDSGQYIDMSWSGVKSSTWGGGVSGSRRLSIRKATVEGVDDFTIARDRLNACFGNYEDHLPNYGNHPIDRGTEVGQYNCSDEDYNTFVNNLQLALDILNGDYEGEVTIELMYEVIENIETSYAAIMASLVQLTIADGNYRIVSALEWTKNVQVDTGEVDLDGNPIMQTITTHPTKAMYATLATTNNEGKPIDGKAMWADIDSTDCRYLWQITNNPETGFIQMKNIATDGILNDCSQSNPATLTIDSQTEMKFEFIERREGGKVVVVMKPSSRGDYGYLHCNGHNSGAGNASNIVGWNASAGASQWILEPVSDEEVAELVEAYAPIKDHELLVSMFLGLIAETEAAIAQAQDETYIAEYEQFITSTSQFSSPYSDPQEGSFANVLNDDPSTFWHSTWHDGNKENHDHFFNVSLFKPVEGDIQCFMRRRGDAGYDHITALGVWGSNDEGVLESTTEDGWTELGSFDLSANASSGQTVTSNVINLASPYQYLRFYIDGTTTGRGYGHFATFRLFSSFIDGNTQWSQMGEDAAAIDTALAVAKAVDLDEMIDLTEYNALKAALDAFKAVLADPSALYAAIQANKDVTSLIAFGENPGFWSMNGTSDTQSFPATLSMATTYLKSGAYTQAQLDAYTEAITRGASDLFAQANPVQEGKWYALKFDSEENYNAHNWSKDGVINSTLGDLYNNYAAPADIEGEGDDAVLACISSLEDITIGQAIRFINDQEIQEMDQVAFRFIAQGDSAFVIQHKSGLYLNGNTRSTNLTLGLMPALFNVRAVGYGKVVIEVRNLKGQGYYSEPVYLHAQNDGHSLVTWNNDVVSSNSAFFIVPVDDFDEGEDVAESVVMSVKHNSMIFMCYPTGFSVEGDAEIYAYQGAFAAEVEEGDTTSVALAHYAFNKVEQAEPGQPVLLVVEDPEYFEPDDTGEDSKYINITPLGTSFAVEPQTAGGVHGTYAYEWVDKGTVVVGGGSIGQAGSTLVLAEGEDGTDCTRDISANTGYIVYGENILKNANTDDFDLVITASKPTIKGDINADDKVDVADVQTVLILIADGRNDKKADVNGDNKVDVADTQTILIMIADQ